jgi:Domain of unknown function (DUF4394)
MGRGRGAIALAAVVLAIAGAAPAADAAELFYAVTESNRLVTFASDSPGNIRSSVPISGVLDSEHILGIDVRPANGRLYGLGSANLMYEIDKQTGQARLLGPLFEVPIRGSSYGFDFDPNGDVARVVSNSELNMRLDPETGLVVDYIPSSPTITPDVDLTYAPGDPSAASGDEAVGALAYAPGGLFGIDTVLDILVRQDPANDGVLHTVGALGVDAGDPGGFDVAADGTAYAAFRQAGRPTQDLYTMDLSTGRVTRSGGAKRLSAVGTYLRGRADPIQALAAGGRVPEDRARPGLVFTPLSTPTVRGLLRGRPLVLLASCSEACKVTAGLRSGRAVVARASRHVRERAGQVKLRLKLTRKGKRTIRHHPARRLRLRVSARDAAGNVTRTR